MKSVRVTKDGSPDPQRDKAVDNGGLRYGAMESALRPPLPTATPPSQTERSTHSAEAQIHARLTNPAKPNIITSIRGSTRQVADIKSEPRPASNRNRWPASYWNAWPASSVSATWRRSSALAALSASQTEALRETLSTDNGGMRHGRLLGRSVSTCS